MTVERLQLCNRSVQGLAAAGFGANAPRTAPLAPAQGIELRGVRARVSVGPPRQTEGGVQERERGERERRERKQVTSPYPPTPPHTVGYIGEGRSSGFGREELAAGASHMTRLTGCGDSQLQKGAIWTSSLAWCAHHARCGVQPRRVPWRLPRAPQPLAPLQSRLLGA